MAWPLLLFWLLKWKCNEFIHINWFDTNECPIKYLYWNLHEYLNILEYSSRFYTPTHSPTKVRIYSYNQIWHEQMSEYICKRKIDTNECTNVYLWPIYLNIWILEYIRHTLVGMLVGRYLLVSSCLPIILIKCLKGHKSLKSLLFGCSLIEVVGAL